MSRINPNRGRARRYVVLAAVALVPLAVAGLVVGAVSQVEHGVDNIPAAIVNNDTLVTTTAADGTKSQILAGRQLVTELTGKDSAGFDWTITNSRDAKQMLADGEVYAVLEVPKDFSKSITSLQSDDPVQADISIQTDDAHNYLTGSVAQVVGDSLVNTFGKQITKQYVDGLTAGLGGLGDALAESSEGASKLADGTDTLADGLSQLSDGAGTAQDGANKYADGVDKYTAGVSKISTGVSGYVGGVSTVSDGVSAYVGGVKDLATGAAEIPGGVTKARDAVVGPLKEYTGGVSTIASRLASAVADLQANPNDPVALATVQALSDNLTAVANNGGAVSGGVTQAFNAVRDGAKKVSSGANTLASKGSTLASGAATLASKGGELASGAKTLAASGGTIATGADGLADGFGTLQSGASKSASGATKLANGTTKLADGLQSGADQVPSSDDSKQASDVATDPIGLTVQRDNKVSDIGQIIGTLFVPLGLWIGALAVFLVMRPVSRRILSSTVGTGRIALATITRALAVTGIQAVVLTIFMHTVLDVRWALLPATFVYSLVMAFAFTAFHYLLTAWLGRAGAIVSIFLLAIQITATGGLYPIQLLAAPFQAISPFLPLTWAVAGMQAIISETGIATVLIVSGGLVVFGVVSLLLTFGAIGRIRRAGALGLVPSHA